MQIRERSLRTCRLSRNEPAVPQVKLTPYSVTAPNELEEILERVAEEGIAWDIEEHELGVCAVSAPIFGPEKELRAVLTVVAPKERFGPKQAKKKAEVVKSTAATISLRLAREILPAPESS